MGEKRSPEKEAYEQLSLFDIPTTWNDGDTVINIYNSKEYLVRNDNGSVVEVFNKDNGYLVMAKSDLQLKSMA